MLHNIASVADVLSLLQQNTPSFTCFYTPQRGIEKATSQRHPLTKVKELLAYQRVSVYRFYLASLSSKTSMFVSVIKM